MLGIEHQRWTTNWTLASRSTRRFTPVVRDGIAIASTGFILGEDQPLGVDAMAARLIAKQLVHDVRWPDLAYLVVDLPPGTSTVQHLLVRELECAGAIVVVTPELVAHLDGRKAVQMFRSLNVRVLSPFQTAPHERSIWAMGVEKLADIPLRFDGTPGPAGAAAYTANFDQFAKRVIAALENL